MDTFVGILVIAAIIVLGVWLSKRSSNKHLAESWQGTVVKKWLASYSDEDGEVTKTPTVELALESGKKKKLALPADLYNSLNEGDKLNKVAGQKYPVKV